MWIFLETSSLLAERFRLPHLYMLYMGLSTERDIL